jgi:hypothetical protein
MVSLGGKVPAWGLSRWAGQGLRFFPPDDEGFTLRGDRQRLVYKGRRRSHRFTILGDTAFEYDCILEREPESNVISLLMDGAERFDFFRQPDFVKDPFLKGSYAVYKKETLVGEGTGKLCHIHRPLIIDARGRRVWGDLSVAGNKLCITIPEEWLSEAKYPVIVDPIVGTATVGSQTHWDNDPPEPWTPLVYEFSIPVNRFLVPETVNGLCTACFYVYSNEEPDSAGYPVLYSDNNNTPLTRRSTGESRIDFRVTSGKPAGWRSGTMQSNGSIASGNYIWFGAFTDCFWYPRFDYGARCYGEYWDYGMEDTVIPDEYPLDHENYYSDFKLSMYFTYTSAQNHVRTLTQGVNLTDSGKPVGNYRRSATETVRGTGVPTGLAGFYRSIIQTAESAMSLNRSSVLIRKLIQQAGTSDTGRRFLSLLRKAAQTAGAAGGTQRITQAKRTIADTGNPGTAIGRKQDFKRNIAHTGNTGTAVLKKADYVKRFQETAGTAMILKRSPTLIRKLIQQAGATDTVQRLMSILRKPAQTAGAASGTQRITQEKRSIADTGRPETAIGGKQDFKRGIAHTESAVGTVLKKAGYVKRFQETAGTTTSTGVVRDVVLRLVEAVAALYEMKAGAGFNRSVADNTGVGSAMKGAVKFFRILFGFAGSGESTTSFIHRMRVIQDTGTLRDETGHTADYLRGLFVEAGTMAETKHRAEYHRKQQDTACSEAVPLRHLFIFIRLLTGAYIRDYIIGQFLRSREELVIKSPVCRKLTLESRLH